MTDSRLAAVTGGRLRLARAYGCSTGSTPILGQESGGSIGKDSYHGAVRRARTRRERSSPFGSGSSSRCEGCLRFDNWETRLVATDGRAVTSAARNPGRAYPD